jgi:zinc/manganese transport system substrate-binding protein/manganese/iron transport system substrate-binding protein
VAKVGLIARPSRPRSPLVTVGTVANVETAPSWNTRTRPPRSAKKSRPSGAKARAVAKVAAMAPVGGDCDPTAHGPVGGGAAVGAVVAGARVVAGAGGAVVVDAAAVVLDTVVGAEAVVVVDAWDRVAGEAPPQPAARRRIPRTRHTGRDRLTAASLPSREAVRTISRMVLAIAGLVACLALAGCGGGRGSDGGGGPVAGRPLRVVATTTVLADFARVLGQDRAEVFDLLKANVDPHDYEATPADLEAVRAADLVVKNGVGLDDWLDRTIKSAGSRARVVDASAGVDLRGDDPHIWHDPLRARTMVATLARAMQEANPEHSAAYSAAEQAYDAELDALHAEIRGQIDALPNKKLVTNHDAFGYYVERFRLDFVGAIIPSFDTQAELSSRELSALVARIRAEGVRAVFSEGSLPPRTAETVAREAGVRVVAGDDALFGDTLGPRGSDADTYVKMMRHNTRTIVENLR